MLCEVNFKALLTRFKLPQNDIILEEILHKLLQIILIEKKTNNILSLYLFHK